MMTAYEIVRALLAECGDCSERDGREGCKAIYYCANRDAADLIESMQAQLNETEARANDKEDMYRDKIRELTAKLAASQRREQAAVEDLESLGRESRDACRLCAHLQCVPKYKKCIGFKWRGPSEKEV